MKRILTLVILLVLMNTLLQAQMYISIKGIPQYYMPLLDTLHIPGALNNWDPAFSYEMVGKNLFKIPSFPGSTEFKITRGSWASVETADNGQDISNRTLVYSPGDTVVIDVKQWKDFYSASAHTSSPQVYVLKSDFQMPQFGRKRRVWIYLPADYYTSGIYYPVLYMHDGQNLFDKPYSFVGEWKVDESLDLLENQGQRSCIVIGIDNGGGDRINEYTPYKHPNYGGGSGEAYTEFLVNTLKPFIDSHFRTLTGPANTGIAGSSLGGLISYFAAIKHPDIFGKVGVFSPSFWFSDSLMMDVNAFIPSTTQKFYIVAGQNEDEDMVPDIDIYIAKMKERGVINDQLLRLIQPDGQHSEWFWAREFPAAYKWLDLWNNNPAATNPLNNDEKFMTINENPSRNPSFKVLGKLNIPKKVVIYDENGNAVQTNFPVNDETFSMDSTSKAGTYFASFTSGKYKQVIKFVKL